MTKKPIIIHSKYLKDEDIHQYSNEEIYSIGAKVISETNKKKLKK